MTAKQTVINILTKNPLARDNDRELYLTYFSMNGLYLTPEQELAFRELPFDTETIRRTRQVVQNDEKKLLANPFVQQARFNKGSRTRKDRIRNTGMFSPEKPRVIYIPRINEQGEKVFRMIPMDQATPEEIKIYQSL